MGVGRYVYQQLQVQSGSSECSCSMEPVQAGEPADVANAREGRAEADTSYWEAVDVDAGAELAAALQEAAQDT